MENPLIHKPLQIIIPYAVLVGKGRTLETVHRIGEIGSKTKSLVRVVNSPRSESDLVMLDLSIIVPVDLGEVRKYLLA